MDELHTILALHRAKKSRGTSSIDEHSIQISVPKGKNPEATYSDIPDVFFDQILIQYKLSRIEILTLLYLYRQVWCRPNLYKDYGISQLLSHTELAKTLNAGLEDIYSTLRKLEELGLISTVRSGQYFIRKFFLKEFDEVYGVNYDDFDI